MHENNMHRLPQLALRPGEVLAAIDGSPALPVAPPTELELDGYRYRMRRSVAAWLGVWYESARSDIPQFPYDETAGRFEWSGDVLRIQPLDLRPPSNAEPIVLRPNSNGLYRIEHLPVVALDAATTAETCARESGALTILAGDDKPYPDDAMVRYIAGEDSSTHDSIREAIARGGAVTPLGLPQRSNASASNAIAAWTIIDVDDHGPEAVATLHVRHWEGGGYTAVLSAATTRCADTTLYLPLGPAVSVLERHSDTFDPEAFEEIFETAVDSVRTRFVDNDPAVTEFFTPDLYR